MVLVVVAYQVYTNPAATRRQVLEKLGQRFLGACVTVESARLNLLGGISVHELRMSRRDDIDKVDFLYVPSATIYHDKEELLSGKLGLRKVVLLRPQLRIILDREGHCNLLGLTGPCSPLEKMPTLVMQQGTIVFEDQRLAANQPLLELHNVNLTVLNDPLAVLTVEGTGVADVLGPVQLGAVLQRNGSSMTGTLDLSAVPLGPELVQRLSAFAPDLAAHLRQFRATGKVQAAVAWRPGTRAPLNLEMNCQLSDGQFSHARLPFPLDHLEAAIRLVNDPPAGELLALPEGSTTACPPLRALLNLRIPAATLTAQAGATRLQGALKDLAVPWPDRNPGDGRPAESAATSPVRREAAGTSHCPPVSSGSGLPEELPLREMTFKVEHLEVAPALFHYLPDAMQSFRDEYKPSGLVTVSHAYQRPQPGRWERHWVIQPEGMDAEFVKFPYPVERITGTIERHTTSDHSNLITIDVAGFASNRPVTVKGTIEGQKQTSGVDLEISGNNLPIDEKMFHALTPSPRCVALAGQFHLEGGTVDTRTIIHRTRGTQEWANRYLLTFHQTAAKYDLFPYRVDNVNGVLDLLPDHWECHDICGQHGEGEVRVEGRSIPPQTLTANGKTTDVPGRLDLQIQGKNLALDQQFEEALTSPGVPGRGAFESTLKMLLPSGRLYFGAHVIDVPGRPKDIDVAVAVRGCGMRPKFFPYALASVSATAHYAHDQIELRDVQAVHGDGTLSMKEGLVLLQPDNVFQVRVPALQGTNISPDAALLAALPPALQKGLACLELRGPFNLNTALVVDQHDPGRPPVVWWDGSVGLRNATMQAGVEVKDLTGAASCRGLFDGQQLRGVVGKLYFTQATALNQPLKNVFCDVEVWPNTPDILRFRNFRSELFGGSLGGEARIEFGPRLKYELVLKGLQIQLEQFGRHNLGASSDIQGPAMIAAHLVGEGSEVTDLKGVGRLDVPNGKLYRLPLLLDLLKAFGLRLPDKTAFEQARMAFSIESSKLNIQDLDLLGNAISLRGQGSLNLDGSNVNLDFSADWARLSQLLPVSVTVLPQAFSDQLLKIKMRGNITDPKFEKELVPGVFGPMKKLMGAAQ
jgi:hypothetical protein